MHSEDDDSLRNRLQHYQEDPDESTWDRIHAQLPADGIVGQRLSMHQELPDEDFWKKIDRALSVYRHARRWGWVANGAVVVSLLLLLVPVFYPIDFNPGEKVQPVISQAQEKSENSASIDLRSTPEERTGSTPTNTAMVRESQRQLVSDGQQLSRAQGDMKLSDLDRLFVPDTSRDTQNLVVNRNEDAEMPTALLESDQKAAKSEKQLLDLQGETDSVAASTELSKAKQKEGESDQVLPGSEKGKRTSDRGSLYMLAMPTLGYQQVTPVKDDGIVVQGFERLSSFSPRRLGVRVEAGWEKSLTPEFSVTIGVLYFQRHQTFVYQFTDTIHTEVYPVEGEPFTFDIKPALQQGTFDYVVKNVGLTAGANYQYRTGHWVQKLGANLELHKNLAGNGVFLFGSAYYRIVYPINDRLEWMAQPTVNYALRLTDRLNAPFYVKPYGLGLSVGMIWRLNTAPNKP